MIKEDNVIIDAKTAHQMTDKEIHDDEACLKPIMVKIKEAIKQKKYECYISASIPDYALQKLVILGYKTKLEKGDPRDPREQDVYYISW